jgi:hypothetical protein
MAEVRRVGPEEIRKQLSELEGKYGMETHDFVLAFRNGHLDETRDFRLWPHLSAAWNLFERRRVPA